MATEEKICPKCREYMMFDKDLNAYHCLCGKYVFENVLTSKKCAAPGCIKTVNGDFKYCTDCSVRMEFHRPQGSKRGIAA